MTIIMLGAPGTGKGTVAGILSGKIRYSTSVNRRYI